MFDNMQFWDEQHIYEHMTVYFKDIKYAHRMYKKRYGSEYSGYSLISAEKYTRIEMLKSILVEYYERDFKDSSIYFSLVLLQKISEISRLAINDKSLIDEYKKRLINVNKYRQVLFDILKKEMKNYGYDNARIGVFEEKVTELNKKWTTYVMLEVVNAVRTNDYIPYLNTDIMELEKCVANLVEEFKGYLEDYSINTPAIKSNESALVAETEKGVEFDLSDEDVVHNWWNQCDDSVKKVIDKNCIIEGYETDLTINIESELVSGNYQAGIYLKNVSGTDAYTFGVENNAYVFLDEVGLVGYKESISGQLQHKLHCKIENNVLTISIRTYGDDKLALLQTNIDCTERYEIGYFCKTWSEPSKVKLTMQLDNKSY